MADISSLFSQLATHQVAGPIRVLGIDLGTTNCTVAKIISDQDSAFQALEPEYLSIRQPILESNQYTNVMVPSVLALYKNQVYIGEGAKRLRAKCGDAKAKLIPEQTIFWEDKNYMGVDKTMYKAPEGYQRAREISGHILRYLFQEAAQESEMPVNKTVVTVPACFQLAQRRDTLTACELAGLDISEGDLLDEPVAAFVHCLFSRQDMRIDRPGQSICCLIFDFGGGTCDVAVYQTRLPQAGQTLQVSPKAVSRYHKLGGGDIDKAIVYEVLIPQLMDQNRLQASDLDFDIKKQALEPALLSTAEMLKIGLCREIDRYEQLGTLEKQDPDQLSKSYPGRVTCPFKGGNDLYLDQPRLSASELARVLAPFVDTEIPYHQENEYRWTCSIFVPVEDALTRADLDSDDIDLCLLVGGSSRIPNVRWALDRFFSKAQIQALSEQKIQTAIASGACIHAFMLQALGQSIVQPCCAESIYIQTTSGPQILIAANTPLPFPDSEAWAQHATLTIPQSADDKPLVLRIELLDSQGRVLMRKPWEIAAPVSEGEKILIHYRMDVNQLLTMKLSLPGKPNQALRDMEVENPVTSVNNPNSKRQEILELEEAMRTSRIPPQKQAETIERIIGLYQDLGQREKAVSLCRKMLRIQGPSAYLLNKAALLYGEIGDYAREEKYYLEADKYSRTWKGPLFNLALSYRRQGRYAEAASLLDRVMQIERSAPYVVLRGIIAEAMDDWEGKEVLLDEALHLFAPVSSLSDWELHWYTRAVRMQGLQEKEQQARQEARKRVSDQDEDAPEGILPANDLHSARM